MPEEWEDKEKYVKNLSLSKLVSYKNLNPENDQIIRNKVEDDFPGYKTKSIKVLIRK